MRHNHFECLINKLIQQQQQTCAITTTASLLKTPTKLKERKKSFLFPFLSPKWRKQQQHEKNVGLETELNWNLVNFGFWSTFGPHTLVAVLNRFIWMGLLSPYAKNWCVRPSARARAQLCAFALALWFPRFRYGFCYWWRKMWRAYLSVCACVCGFLSKQ